MRVPRVHRTLAVGLAGALALALTTACEPKPPAPHFTVNTIPDGADAAPGDGVCEVTVGTGDCSLRAAVDEGNALGRAVITLPGGYVELGDPGLEITGALVVRGTDGTDIDGNGATEGVIHVAAGGSLNASRIDLGSLGLLVDGSLVFEQGTIGSFYSTGVEVGPGGNALLRNVRVQSLLNPPALVNAGTLLVDHATVGGLVDYRSSTGIPYTLETGGVATLPGGNTYLRGTWLASGSCTGEQPTSQGYNGASDDSCGLDGPGDLTDAPVYETRLGAPEPPLPSGALVDAVPSGTAGCGSTVAVDIDGAPRPADGDGDGVAACDIGAIERPPSAD